MAEVDCRYFNGYKPCGKSETCDASCEARDVPASRICIVHLSAIGAVLRATSLLPSIKRRFPNSHLTWVTDRPSGSLFRGNHWVDQVYELSFDALLELKNSIFDGAIVIDKSRRAAGVLEHLKVEKVLGFRKDPRTGAIVPANPEAEALWQLGLSNCKKFFENQKPETTLMAEAFGLEARRDPYQIFLSFREEEQARERRRSWSAGRSLIGINTGCSEMIPYRKFSVERTRRLIRDIQEQKLGRVVLLGGPSETARNQRIAEGLDVLQSPTERGLRDGLVSTAACDVVVSGDSLGMHMAIALKKWVVAWFGPTCEQEIDLYERGVKVLSSASCSPCWKRHCEKNPMCYDLVDGNQLIRGIAEGLQRCKKYSSSKRHLWEISS